MKEILLKFNMDVLVQSDHLVKVRGQKPLNYANGDRGGWDMFNLRNAVRDCFRDLGFVVNRQKAESGDKELLLHGSIGFGDEILKVVVRVGVYDYDTYLPEGSKHLLLKETKWEGKRMHLPHVHYGDSGRDGGITFKNIVLNNVVYPCSWDDDKHRDMYEDAIDALYDEMYRNVRSLSVKHGYGDIADRNTPEVKVCTEEESYKLTEGKDEFWLMRTMVIILTKDDSKNKKVHRRCMYIKVPDTESEEAKETEVDDTGVWRELSYLAQLVIALDDQERLICVSDTDPGISAGCAAAISDYFSKDGIKWFADDKYTPDKVIYRKMSEALKHKYEELRLRD